MLEAVAAPDAAQWKEAMDAEVQALNKYKTWDLVKLPMYCRALQTRWVYGYNATETT